ncbi:MAG: hypothetical protein ABIH23_06220 [bacterium]
MLENWLEFARGPLFRLALALCVLGLARNVLLTVWAIGRTYLRAADKDLPFKAIAERTIRWIIPFRLSVKNRFFYSICSILFHVGLILVPIFLFAHIRLWEAAIGIGWFALPRTLADILTIVTVITGIILFMGRLGSSASRAISHFQDILWPPSLIVPFLSGFLCAHPSWCPINYHWMMLVHVLSAELILVFMPFTKIAHCVLFPFSQLISDLGWRFPASSGRDVEITLGKQGQLT